MTHQRPLISLPVQMQPLAMRYVWWESQEWAIKHPVELLASIMDAGTWEDIQLVRHLVGDDNLKKALAAAPPGYFHPRSWDYWHLKLNLLPIPALPKRNFR